MYEVQVQEARFDTRIQCDGTKPKARQRGKDATLPGMAEPLVAPGPTMLSLVLFLRSG